MPTLEILTYQGLCHINFMINANDYKLLALANNLELFKKFSGYIESKDRHKKHCVDCDITMNYIY